MTDDERVQYQREKMRGMERRIEHLENYRRDLEQRLATAVILLQGAVEDWSGVPVSSEAVIGSLEKAHMETYRPDELKMTEEELETVVGLLRSTAPQGVDVKLLADGFAD